MTKLTKAYIKTLLQSEDIIANQDAIEQCLFGWKEAINDPDRIEHTRKLQKAFYLGYPWAIGFCSYTYRYWL